MKLIPRLFGIALLSLVALGARAEIVTFGGVFSPDNEVPPVTNSNGSGLGFFALDTSSNTFTWSIAFEDLTGPVAGPGAHIHAQAAGTVPGAANGGVIINLDTDPGVVLSGVGQSDGLFFGSTTLSDDPASSLFVNNLLDGLWYANIHTIANVSGEIRGQILRNDITVVPLPAGALLLVSAIGIVAVRIRRRKT